jgi:glycosyltransferase involved in cell wall biosynthesis
MTRFVVVTPLLNAATFIGATLDSVDAQGDPDWVHYLVDGGSTDGTLEVLAESASDEPRRHILTGKDRSLYDAIFKGFERAAEDGHTDPDTICVWLNSDDLLMPWAFATLRQAFEETGAEWITALPSLWDKDGRLVLIQPFNWYPRLLIRAGQFHARSMGFIQQESTFFRRSLLSKLSDSDVEMIRKNKLAGDFLLWREFARHATLVPIAAPVAGFRNHGANASLTQWTRYFDEIKAAGIWVPPLWLGRIFRLAYLPFAMAATTLNFRRRYAKFAAITPPASTS